MGNTRDHEPLVIEDFGGWWQRGDPESAPSDHFTQADNVQFIHSGVETRDGVINYILNPPPPLQILRVYNYVTQKGQTLIMLTPGGKIYHVLGPNGPIHGPILTIPAMEDFGFVAINGRAFITPHKTFTNPNGDEYQLGLPNDFLYVYLGDGTSMARTAAGLPPSGSPLVVANDAFLAGATDTGLHLLAIVFETDTGYLTAPGPEVFGQLDFDGDHLIKVSNIPVGPLEPGGGVSRVIRRHIVSTKAIPAYNGDQVGYQFFFIPGGSIDDNTTTFKIGRYFDSDLISDASHLVDNFSQIPATVNLNTYHSRLVMVGEFGTTETLQGLPPDIKDNRSIARVSFAGEPESVSKIDGIIVAPLDGNPLTNVQEFRDILYLFKKTRSISYSDNNDEPVTWQEEILDQGVGAPIHGIATVLDTGGVNTDFLLILDWSGLMLFNGTYAQPEMTWKIEDFWRGLDRDEFYTMQVVNDSINKKLWVTLPAPYRHMLLHANYQNGMNAKDIRWSRWVFNARINTIALVETDRLVIGTDGPRVVETTNVR